MRRALVLSTESARHPFRQSLPPMAFRLVQEEATSPQPKKAKPFASRDDILFFAASFAGCFVLIYGLIA